MIDSTPLPHRGSAIASDGVSPPPSRFSFDLGEDSMTLHTVEAFNLFTGRSADAAAGVTGIPGGRRFAAILKSLGNLSARDNPYADWLLIRLWSSLEEVRSDVLAAARAHEASLEQLVGQGMTLRVLAARQPRVVYLGFRSPYGFGVAESVLEFDRFVRVVKTLALKNRLQDGEDRTEVRAMTRRFRTLFQDAIAQEKRLLGGAIRTVVRADFLPEADEAARKRATDAASVFGAIPIDVLIGRRRPRHGARRSTLTPAQLEYLEGHHAFTTTGSS